MTTPASTKRVASKLTPRSFRSGLSTEQFSNSGPAPTSEDAYSTVAHLADGVAWNQKHGARHMARAIDVIDQMGPPTSKKDPMYVLKWNLEHAAKHSVEAGEHAKKLAKHVRGHPAFREESADLRRTDPARHGAA